MQPLKHRPDPAPSRLAYRLERLMLTPLFRRGLKVGLPFALAFAAGAVVLGDADRQERIVAAIGDLRRQIETRPEFMVQLLEIEGASDAVEAEIREIFPYDLPASSFEIDLDYLREAITGLPAVADSELRIRRGGVLAAQVRERVPVALWRDRDGLKLVDRHGAVVATLAGTEARPALPLVAGEGANADIPGALAILDAAAPLGTRVVGLVRMGERRWDVVLQDDAHIMLPETDPVRALERVIVLNEVHDVLERDVVAVDMRLPARPTVRMKAYAVDEWWRATQMMAGDSER
ncbi:cell division protein FtsQ/DivIB [Roseovarius amoyensis]|uniref:cell division protein FtsQ/DivIB n=1 Tax=Roseovarius amoyensis TaxID=2211448 RepID=UPI001EF8ED51|nr:cell division protein FtsQ/DivIB [Roseovarius amoyensis]